MSALSPSKLLDLLIFYKAPFDPNMWRQRTGPAFPTCRKHRSPHGIKKKKQQSPPPTVLIKPFCVCVCVFLTKFSQYGSFFFFYKGGRGQNVFFVHVQSNLRERPAFLARALHINDIHYPISYLKIQWRIHLGNSGITYRCIFKIQRRRLRRIKEVAIRFLWKCSPGLCHKKMASPPNLCYDKFHTWLPP